MINNFPFFIFPFYPYPRGYSRNIYSKHNDRISYYETNNLKSSNHPRINRDENHTDMDNNTRQEKKSSNYSSIGPILINTNGFSNQEEPLIEFSGLKLYLDDLIILSLLFFLYKEDVKDDMLFILLILLLIT